MKGKLIDKIAYGCMGFLLGWNILSLIYFYAPKGILGIVLKYVFYSEILFILLVILAITFSTKEDNK